MKLKFKYILAALAIGAVSIFGSVTAFATENNSSVADEDVQRSETADESDDHEYITSGYYSYYVDDERNGAVLCTYSNPDELSDGVLNIPDEIDGNPVVRVKAYLFSSMEGIKTINIGKNFSSIGVYAFYDLPELENFQIDDENESFCVVDGVLFSKDKTKLMQYPSGRSDTEYVVPEGVTYINEGAMAGTVLTKITLPQTLTEMGEWAFASNESLTDVNFPASLKFISRYAFAHCSSLQNLNFVEGLEYTSYASFGGCTSLTSVTFPDGFYEVGRGSFSHCSALSSVTFPNSLITICESAFADCESLKVLEIPDSCTTISDDAFGCFTVGDTEDSEGNYQVSYAKYTDFKVICSTISAAYTYANTAGLQVELTDPENESGMNVATSSNKEKNFVEKIASKMHISSKGVIGLFIGLVILVALIVGFIVYMTKHKTKAQQNIEVENKDKSNKNDSSDDTDETNS